MVTVRVLEKGNELKLAGGQLVVGILILEDILAVLLLVVLSGIGLSGVLSWGGLFHGCSLGGICGCILAVGRFLIPRLGIWVSKVGEAELLTLFAAALAMGLGLLVIEIRSLACARRLCSWRYYFADSVGSRY